MKRIATTSIVIAAAMACSSAYATTAITATPLVSEFVALVLLACVFGFGNVLAFAQIVAILARVG